MPFSLTKVSSMIELTVSPKNAEIIRGGASWPPSLNSFPEHETEDKYSFEFLYKALNWIKIKSLKILRFYGFLGMPKRLHNDPSAST